jgi:hypothetical protein
MRKRRSVLFLAFASALLALAPGSALATAPNNESATYEWVPERGRVERHERISALGV